MNVAQVVEAIESRHNIQGEGGQPTHFAAVFQSLIDSALSTMDTKIEHIARRVSDMVGSICEVFSTNNCSIVHNQFTLALNYLTACQRG